MLLLQSTDVREAIAGVERCFNGEVTDSTTPHFIVRELVDRKKLGKAKSNQASSDRLAHARPNIR